MMNLAAIAQERMYNSSLAAPMFDNPVDVVEWLGAVQSQEYANAKWAVAQRTRGTITDADLEQAFNDGAILRTHVMRPTWHFVTPSDIRWMLALTAPRVNVAVGYYYRQLGLDDEIFRRSNNTLVKTLEGGKQLLRKELAVALEAAGIAADGLRLAHLIMRAELDGIICSGPRRGKQFTYALLEERVPPAKPLTRDEALAELTKRYFRSHGPAMLQDFAWWSGLTMAEVREGVELLKPQLHQEPINDKVFWYFPSQSIEKPHSPTAYLLPAFDEAIASYQDYHASIEPQYARLWIEGDPDVSHYLVIEGKVAGSWRRTFSKKTVQMELKPFTPLTEDECQAVTDAAHRYGEFLGLAVELR